MITGGWPQLLLQAFLQRIVNGGGRVEREYGLGRMRADLLIVWPVNPVLAGAGPKTGGWPVQKVVIELKILYKSLEKTISEEAHLVIFDRRPKVSWKQKLFQRAEIWQGHSIVVWGM